jgi:type I restriction enzyme R subunit
MGQAPFRHPMPDGYPDRVDAWKDGLLARWEFAVRLAADMIAKLLELAKWVREAGQQGQALGLSDQEVAFYDALAENGSAKEVMKSDRLGVMAREPAEMVKRMPKLDRTQREVVRADLRRKVRRLLALYGYPPNLSEDATQLVLR